MRKFLIIIEKAGRNYSAYCPDLPGCVATGKTRAATEQNMYGAIEMHLEAMREENKPIPACLSEAEYVIFPSRPAAAPGLYHSQVRDR
jgi:predicted RNase H-like HicB family nuclease